MPSAHILLIAMWRRSWNLSWFNPTAFLARSNPCRAEPLLSPMMCCCSFGYWTRSSTACGDSGTKRSLLCSPCAAQSFLVRRTRFRSRSRSLHLMERSSERRIPVANANWVKSKWLGFSDWANCLSKSCSCFLLRWGILASLVPLTLSSRAGLDLSEQPCSSLAQSSRTRKILRTLAEQMRHPND